MKENHKSASSTPLFNSKPYITSPILMAARDVPSIRNLATMMFYAYLREHPDMIRRRIVDRCGLFTEDEVMEGICQYVKNRAPKWPKVTNYKKRLCELPKGVVKLQPKRC